MKKQKNKINYGMGCKLVFDVMEKGGTISKAKKALANAGYDVSKIGNATVPAMASKWRNDHFNADGTRSAKALAMAKKSSRKYNKKKSKVSPKRIARAAATESLTVLEDIMTSNLSAAAKTFLIKQTALNI